MGFSILKLLNRTAAFLAVGIAFSLSACFGSSPQGSALPISSPAGLGAAPSAGTPPPSTTDDANANANADAANDPGSPEVAARMFSPNDLAAQPFGGQRPSPSVDLGGEYRYLVTNVAEPYCPSGQGLFIHITGQVAKPDPEGTNPFSMISTEECNGRILRVVNTETRRYKDLMTHKDPVTQKNCSYELSMKVDPTPDLTFLVGKEDVTSSPLDTELPCDAAHCQGSDDFDGAFRDSLLLNLAHYFNRGITPCGTDFIHLSTVQPQFDRTAPVSGFGQDKEKILQNLRNVAPDAVR